jgi:hypothetical protein
VERGERPGGRCRPAAGACEQGQDTSLCSLSIQWLRARLRSPCSNPPRSALPRPQILIESELRSDGFGFDAIFGAEVGGAPSAELYASCVRPLVEGLFEGINGTVFAYGQTGAGKSYTMVG